jgi:hypothetical protein
MSWADKALALFALFVERVEYSSKSLSFIGMKIDFVQPCHHLLRSQGQFAVRGCEPWRPFSARPVLSVLEVCSYRSRFSVWLGPC